MPIYTVRYQAGTYSGTRTVNVEDEECAIAYVRRKVREQMTLPMYSESYKIVRSYDTERDA